MLDAARLEGTRLDRAALDGRRLDATRLALEALAGVALALTALDAGRLDRWFSMDVAIDEAVSVLDVAALDSAKADDVLAVTDDKLADESGWSIAAEDGVTPVALVGVGTEVPDDPPPQAISPNKVRPHRLTRTIFSGLNSLTWFTKLSHTTNYCGYLGN